MTDTDKAISPSDLDGVRAAVHALAPYSDKQLRAIIAGAALQLSNRQGMPVTLADIRYICDAIEPDARLQFN